MSVLSSSRPTACANALGTYGPRGLALVAKTAPCAAVNRRGCKLSRSVGCGPDGPVARNRAQQSRSEEHTSELQSLRHLVCRLLLEKKNEVHRQQGHDLVLREDA